MNNTYIRSFVIVPIKNDDGEHFGGVFGFLRSLKSAITKFKPDEVLIAWDGPKSGLKRKQMFPEYKANRRKDWKRGSVKAFDFMSEQQQSDNFGFQLRRVHEYLDKFPVKTIQIPYLEADDIIAQYVQYIGGNEAVIYSTDADFKQLITDKILHYNPISKKLLSRDTFVDEKGYEPHNYKIVKTIMGDSSDNIPGIKGIGEKTLMKLYPSLVDSEEFEFDDLVDNATHILNSGAKGYTKSQLSKYRQIVENEKLLQLNYKLMQLNDVDISVQTKDVILSVFNDSPHTFDRFNLRKMFLEDKLWGAVKNFNIWSNTFSGLQLGKGKSFWEDKNESD